MKQSDMEEIQEHWKCSLYSAQQELKLFVVLFRVMDGRLYVCVFAHVRICMHVLYIYVCTCFYI